MFMRVLSQTLQGFRLIRLEGGRGGGRRGECSESFWKLPDYPSSTSAWHERVGLPLHHVLASGAQNVVGVIVVGKICLLSYYFIKMR